MKYVITNADDYGYSSDISQAILDTHKSGLLTSTSVMINQVSQEDVDKLKASSGLSAGLHLNLTSGEPVSQHWKDKFGSFHRPKKGQPEQFDRDLWIEFFEQFLIDDIQIEYQAQYEKFVELFGQKPSHLDSHHYTSVYECVFPAFVDLAHSQSIPVRLPAIWETKDKQHPMGNMVTSELQAYQVTHSYDLISTNYFSNKYLNRHTNWLAILGEELSNVADGESIELSFHPGHEDEWRQKDFDLLTSKELKDAFATLGVELITFTDLAKL